MIEEIRKEMLRLDEIVTDSRYKNGINKDKFVSYRKSDVLKTLDKYNNQQNYLIVDKKMFKKRLDNQLCNDYEPDCEDYWLAGLEDNANENEKYKNAWEELMNLYRVTYKDTMSKNDYAVLYKLEEIEQKNGIKGE